MTLRRRPGRSSSCHRLKLSPSKKETRTGEIGDRDGYPRRGLTDGAYREIFIRRVRSIGIRDRPTSTGSPLQYAYAERAIGSIRRECLDHIVEISERHLGHVALSFLDYYKVTLSHSAL